MKKLRSLVVMMVMVMTGSMTAYAAAPVVDSISAVNTTADIDVGASSPTNTEETTVKVSQGSSFVVKIPKKITLAGASGVENSAEYVITVKGDLAGDDIVEVTPDTSFKMSSTGKSDITANVTTFNTQFSIGKVLNSNTDWDNDSSLGGSDVTITDALLRTGVTSKGRVKVDGLSAGDWTGSFNFTIELQHK